MMMMFTRATVTTMPMITAVVTMGTMMVAMYSGCSNSKNPDIYYGNGGNNDGNGNDDNDNGGDNNGNGGNDDNEDEDDNNMNHPQGICLFLEHSLN